MVKGLDNFKKRVLEKLKEIPQGKVTTYKLLARSLKGRSVRGVARILANNPSPDKYPCYKVVYSDGRIGGYKLGLKKKKELLQQEGVKIKNDRIKNFQKILYRFDN